MMENFESMNLFLFGEGAASGGGAGEMGAGEGTAGGSDTGMDAASQRAEEQAGDAGQDTQQRDLKAEWERIRADKDLKPYMDEHVQKIFNRRFAAEKQQQESLQKMTQAMEKLAARYGMESADPERLIAAMDGDESFLQAQADKHGMDQETYRKFDEALRFKAKQQQLMNEQQRAQQNAQWVAAKNQEAEALKQKYPAFDLEAELQNQHFRKMIQMDMPMEMAYTAVHHSELMQGGMQYAAQTAQKQVTDNVQARGMRPREGAAKGNGGIVAKLSARDLSAKDLRDYNRRLKAGEHPKYEDYVKRR